MEQKDLLRKEILQKRSRLSKDYREESEAIMLDKLRQLPEYQAATMIFCYVGMPDEIQTARFIQQFFSDNKRVCVPKVVSKTQMLAYEITSFDELAPGVMGILEPISQKEVLPSEIDLGLIPCITADLNGFRLGYGGGYYDRYLEKSKMYKVLCLWSKLLVAQVPIEAHDQPVDKIMTEK